MKYCSFVAMWNEIRLLTFAKQIFHSEAISLGEAKFHSPQGEFRWKKPNEIALGFFLAPLAGLEPATPCITLTWNSFAVPSLQVCRFGAANVAVRLRSAITCARIRLFILQCRCFNSKRKSKRKRSPVGLLFRLVLNPLYFQVKYSAEPNVK